MKKIALLLALGGLLFSCSDKLTESKVKELVEECLKKEPLQKTKTIYIGDVGNFLSNELSVFAEKGLLTIEVKENKSPLGIVFGKRHIVSLTEKAKPFVIENTDSTAELILFTYELDKVGSIQEIPMLNGAEVQITYKKANKTPFYDALVGNETDFIKKKIMIRKTENKGWVYCD